MENKIPFYNIVNIFFIGLIFFIVFIFLYYSKLTNLMNLYPEFIELCSKFMILIYLVFIGIIYEIGLIINRISSIATEPFLKKTKIIKFMDDYAKFNNCKRDNPFLYTLSREYAFSRVSFTLWVFLTIMFLVTCHWLLCLFSVIVSFIFLLSCRKMSIKIYAILSSYGNKK